MAELSFEAQSALRPTHLIRPERVSDELAAVELTSGVYGWWFDATLPYVPRDGCLRIGGRHLLYIGTAPVNARGMTKKPTRSLKNRLLKNHVRGDVRNSTLRYSVASLLDEEFHFKVKRDSKNRPSMMRNEKNRLSQWLSDHASVSVFGCLEPWIIEEEILRNGPPLPLNILKTSHPFGRELKRFRKLLGSR